MPIGNDRFGPANLRAVADPRYDLRHDVAHDYEVRPAYRRDPDPPIIDGPLYLWLALAVAAVATPFVVHAILPAVR